MSRQVPLSYAGFASLIQDGPHLLRWNVFGDNRKTKASQRCRISKGEWVRRAIEHALAQEGAIADPLARLAGLGAPTADIDQMLAEIDAGRS